MNVFVAESSSGFSEQLGQLIGKIDGVRLIGTALDAYGAIEGFLDHAQRRAPPDLLILDTWLDEGNGVGVLRFVKQQFPQTKIVMLCGCGVAQCRQDCCREGADFFLEYDEVASRLPEIVTALNASGEAPIPGRDVASIRMN